MEVDTGKIFRAVQQCLCVAYQLIEEGNEDHMINHIDEDVDADTDEDWLKIFFFYIVGTRIYMLYLYYVCVMLCYVSYNKKKLLRLCYVKLLRLCLIIKNLGLKIFSENFLFVNDQEDSPLKAIDFGLSMFLKPGMFLTKQRFLFSSYIN